MIHHKNLPAGVAQKKKSLVTALMSVRDEKPEYLNASINSILDQTFSDFEFIIINDGSTKHCQEQLEIFSSNPQIKIINNQQNLGLATSLNHGLRMASGKYIARIDSDDLAEKHRLEKQLIFMRENPDHALCGSWSHIIDADNNIIGQKKFSSQYDDIKKNIIYFNFFTHSSLFFKKDIALQMGGYDETMKKAQDYDLILKISARYPVANLPEFLCSNRQHSQSITSRQKKPQEWYALKARIRAIMVYGYPRHYFWKIIPSVIYLLFVPYFVEQRLFKLLLRKCHT